MSGFLSHIPVVSGLAYIEAVRVQPSSFTVTLVPEPDNRYFRQALAVQVGEIKLGYVAPEVSSRYYASVAASAVAVTCPARRGSYSDHETSGVELLLDFSELSVPPAA